MPYNQTIEVGDDLNEVSRVQEELSKLWECRELPPDIEMPVSLGLEEVLSNVLRHSVIDGRSREIRVTFQFDDRGFEFEVSDSASPYDPLSRPDPDLNIPLEERTPGGLGVYLAKQFADEIAYERRNGRNCLRFRKLFPSDSAE
jgi:anti-sigma regulatory factor (Ser/Thr protein kinase)